LISKSCFATHLYLEVRAGGLCLYSRDFSRQAIKG
jgi:hypothetical protein